jgi:hypothetical protein
MQSREVASVPLLDHASGDHAGVAAALVGKESMRETTQPPPEH